MLWGEGQTTQKRGGSWNNNPRNCRSAYRNNNNPDNANNNNGFRVCVLPSTLLCLSKSMGIGLAYQGRVQICSCDAFEHPKTPLDWGA